MKKGGQKHKKTAVLIPCYNVEQSIENVIAKLPDDISTIITVDDSSNDQTLEILHRISKTDNRVIVVSHPTNMGVGGAMKSAFRYALNTDCNYFIKLDGDGQMDARYIPALLNANSGDEFSKGNRFHDLSSLEKMPVIRRIGNLGLNFLIKAASGYWDVFDPTNGYFCINRRTLEKINIDRLSDRFFFESSLIIELYYTGTKIVDVPMPAIYGAEKSNLSILHTLLSFPPKLIKALARRILLRYFLYDFNIASLFFLFGVPLLFFGVVFGLVNWIHYAKLGIPAPTGTVIIPVLTIVLGFQLLLSAIQFDIENGKFKF